MKCIKTCPSFVTEIQNKVPNCLIVLVGNKIDLADRRQVSSDEVRDYCNRFEPPIPYFETSAKTGEGVNELFESSVRMRINARPEEVMKRNYSDNDNERNNSLIEDDEDDKENETKRKCVIC